MRTLRALIVDDERLARQRLRRLLLQEPGVEVVAECRGVQEARGVLEREPLDVAFVDVQMPRATGFDLVRPLERDVAPAMAIVFVTAHERYAVEAFDVRACDYLLKPVASPRLKLAVERARATLAQRSDTVFVRTASAVVPVHIDAIDWIEAAGNYVLVHVGAEEHLLRETLTALEAGLPAQRFARVHRTAIVNLDRVVAFELTDSGDLLVTLRGGAKVRMSRSYRGRIRDRLGHAI